MNREQVRMLALVALIAVAAASRLVPHPQNFTAIGAMALFAGATLGDRRLAFFVPLAALFVSDLVIGLHGLLPLVYALFSASVCMGFALRGRVASLPVAGAGFGCALLFYLVTNFAVWAGGSLYPQTWEGLAACYVAAIPFFQNSLLGNLFYSALLFGGLALVERGFPSLREPSSAN